MNKILIILFILAFSCKNEKTKNIIKTEYQDIIKEDYELSKPTKNTKAVLILFGGYPEIANDIKREFNIIDLAKNNNIAILYMNYNRKIWFEKNEALQLSKTLEKIFKENDLPTNNVYIGGLSSGGNIALLISDFMTRQNFVITPKGTFIVDSPIDLAELYDIAKKTIKKDLPESAKQEFTWLLQTFNEKLGNPNIDISKYEEHSVFTSKTNNIDNIKSLKSTKIRLYTEPDTIWWNKNMMVDYEDLNAYYIKKLSLKLNKLKFKDVEYIATKDKGYRANGNRHPHSWSIIDKKDLISWMIND